MRQNYLFESQKQAFNICGYSAGSVKVDVKVVVSIVYDIKYLFWCKVTIFV